MPLLIGGRGSAATGCMVFGSLPAKALRASSGGAALLPPSPGELELLGGCPPASLFSEASSPSWTPQICWRKAWGTRTGGLPLLDQWCSNTSVEIKKEIPEGNSAFAALSVISFSLVPVSCHTCRTLLFQAGKNCPSGGEVFYLCSNKFCHQQTGNSG